MSAVVLVPYQPSDEWRRAAWARVADHLCQLHWPIAIGEWVTGEWRKGAALADAASYAHRAPVYVIHDADCMVSPQTLQACVTACAEGEAWAMPHQWVHRLNKAATATVEAGTAMPWEVPEGDRDRVPYRGVPGGGVTVVRADVWAACPVDPRFAGWGGEDEAWGWALTTLHGRPWRPPAGDNRLWHLWHPHPAPRQRFPTDPGARELLQAYRNARGIPRIMRAVIAGTAPPPPLWYGEPVRFRLVSGWRGLRSLRAGGHIIQFHDGVAEVTSGDSVEALDLLAGVQRC